MKPEYSVRENRRRLIEKTRKEEAEKKTREEKKKYAQEMNRYWKKSFCTFFPPDFEITGPKNYPECASRDYPGDFPAGGGSYIELGWKGIWEDYAGRGAVCPVCGVRSEEIHEYEHRVLFDLPFYKSGKAELWLDIPRYRCANFACQRAGFAPKLMDPLNSGRRNMTRRLQEFVVLLADRVGAEMTSRILAEMGMVSAGENMCSGDTVLRLQKEFAEDPELCKYTVPAAEKAGLEDLEECAEKLQYGLICAIDDIMTVWENRYRGRDRERIAGIVLRPRMLRLEAMKRVLDQVFTGYQE